MSSKISHPIPHNKLQKSKVIGKATLKIGLSKGTSILKRRFLSKKNKKQEKIDNNEKIAGIIMEALGELKGVSVKIAQQIGLNLTFLPPEFLAKLEQSFNQIPPLNRAVVRKVFKREFDCTPTELYESFESEVFAAASLGQVHRASIDKEQVVVKVQYPAIDKSIQSDIAIMHFMLKKVAKSEQISHLIDEVSDRLYEEIDYENEAKNMEYFRKNLNIKNIIIPKHYPKHSTQRVLTTQMLNGVILQDYLANNPSQKQRNHYANLLFESFFKSLYELRCIHADPNPGNYLFMDEGKLGMIDFGCVKRIDTDFLRLYSKLHLALIEGRDEEYIIRLYTKLGMIEEGSKAQMQKFYREIIHPLDSLYIEPFIQDSFDFSLHHDFSKRGFEAVMEVQKKQSNSIDKLNQEFIFLDRTLLGLYAIFEKLGAVVDTRYAKEWMERGV